MESISIKRTSKSNYFGGLISRSAQIFFAKIPVFLYAWVSLTFYYWRDWYRECVFGFRGKIYIDVFYDAWWAL